MSVVGESLAINLSEGGEEKMISVGIDVSKGKSMVCVFKPYGEVVKTPYEIQHTQEELERLFCMIKEFDEEVRVVMEATSNYHLPVLSWHKT